MSDINHKIFIKKTRGWALDRVYNSPGLLIAFNIFLHFVTLTFDFLT